MARCKSPVIGVLQLPLRPSRRRAMSTRSWVLLLIAAVTACSDGTLPSVPPPPPPPTSVAVAYCIQPAWVAFQDGDGAWTRAQPVLSGSNTTFGYEFSAGRGAIATLSRVGDNMTVLSVLYGTPAELVTAGDTNSRDCGPAPAKTLLGTVAQLDTNETAFVSASFNSRVRVSVDRTFELKGLTSAPRARLCVSRSVRARRRDCLPRWLGRPKRGVGYAAADGPRRAHSEPVDRSDDRCDASLRCAAGESAARERPTDSRRQRKRRDHRERPQHDALFPHAP